MFDVGKAVGAGKFTELGKTADTSQFVSTAITQPRNVSSSTNKNRKVFSGRLRPVLIIAALLISLPFLRGIVACGGSGNNAPVGGVEEGELGSGGGIGVGITTTESSSEDYRMRQQFGNALALPTMRSTSYKIGSAISDD